MKTVAILMFNGMEDVEFVTTYDILFRAGIEVHTFSLEDDSLEITTRSNLVIKADTYLSYLNKDNFDMLVIPGGPGVTNVNSGDKVDQVLIDFFEADKYVAAICAAPKIIASRGHMKGVKFTSHSSVVDDVKKFGGDYQGNESNVTVDNNIITSKSFATTFDFALTIVEELNGKEERIKLEESF